MTSFLHRIVSRPAIYDLVQRAVGVNEVYRHMQPHLDQSAGRTLLDVGAGTGSLAAKVPASCRYIWLDCDTDKLRGYLRKKPGGVGVLTDGATLCLKDKSVDDAVVMAVAHHIPDEALPGFFAEVSRVARRRLIFVDPLRVSDPFVSNLLWRYDRGSFPRTEEELRSHLTRHFELATVDCFSVFHHYVLCVGRPRG